MTICKSTGFSCTCQPDEGVFCPDRTPDEYEQWLMQAIVELRALAVPEQAPLDAQLARSVAASESGEHDPLCMSILRGKACDCGAVPEQAPETCAHGYSGRAIEICEQCDAAPAALPDGKDAERLNWIEQWTEGDVTIYPPGQHAGAADEWLVGLDSDQRSSGMRGYRWSFERSGKTLRAAIDAVIKAQKNNET